MLRSFRLALTLVFVAGLSSCGLARQALYAPRTATVEIAERVKIAALAQNISVTTDDGLSLKGFFWAGDPGDKDIVLFFHGRGADQGIGAKYAQYMVGHGDGVLVASYRGFGGNPGSPSRNGLLKDAAAFVALAQRHVGEGGRIWFVGHSLGGGVALAAAQAYGHAAGVVTISTFDHISQAAPKITRAFIPDKWDNLAAARALNAPLVLLHGTADDVVPFASQQRIYAAAKSPSVAISMPQANHKPNMQMIGPWISAAIASLTSGHVDALPPMPGNWVIAGQRDTPAQAAP